MTRDEWQGSGSYEHARYEKIGLNRFGTIWWLAAQQTSEVLANDPRRVEEARPFSENWKLCDANQKL
jgi:hypothetical protein